MQDNSIVLSHAAQSEKLADQVSQETQAAAYPKIPPVQAENIPELLKSVKQWIVWRAGPLKPNGKFDKIPTCPRTGRNIDHLHKSNWDSFNTAMAAYEGGIGDGVGFVLSAKHKVTVDATDYHIVAVDLDGVVETPERVTGMRETRLRLGNPYTEISPSGNGVRMFALSTEIVHSGNAGEGRELYCDKRFVTVTGRSAKGRVKDATTGLVALGQEWFGTKTPTPKKSLDDHGLGYNLGSAPPPETEDEIARVKDALSYVSPDIPYELWRNIVWAILSTGWTCAERLARDWSMGVSSIKGAKHVYEEAAFDALVGDFDPTRGISVGTLFHHAQVAGWDSTRSHNEVIHVAPPAETPSFKLLTAAEVKAQPNMPYRVRGLLPAQGLAAMYGQPGTGKSFLAMDLCFAVAAGRAEWFGIKLKQAAVVWVALEGRAGVSKRIKAWEIEHGVAVPTGAWFLLDDLVLSDAQSVDAFVSTIGDAAQGAIIVIDTLNQSAPGMDENASKDVGAVLANAKKLAERVNGLVLLIHHAGKDATKGMRGHSSLNAAMDATILVAQDKGHRYFTVTKAKDDTQDVKLDFELISHVVGQDEDGLDITSCAVRPTIHTPATAAPKKPPTGKNQIAALKKVRELLANAPNGMSFGEAVEGVAAVLDREDRRRKPIATATINSLIKGGHLDLNEGVITLP